ncbi:ABC-three component system protein [Sphingomonas glacialis]|uniref:ABC-three component systems C-terminal domain-containing protein n=1 Tax=Sphingomonas glacialis TaxID=658225 RepID=A0A502FFG2_9SPHN|nr:ABC-three component system protein [Sphingomonas glacialis]TPG48079.1 hypothetical protein EAH76_21955 [Sphingomonas glacialis]
MRRQSEDSLDDHDVVRGAAIPGYDGLYAIGIADIRITIYSQQVRAFQLVHSLLELGKLKDGQHVAIIGGGVAGVAAAAAILVSTETICVTLFEAETELFYVQRECSVRYVHPHLYEWPRANSINPTSDLPILSWEAGSAADVVERIAGKFAQIQSLFAARLTTITGARVSEIEATMDLGNPAFQLSTVTVDNSNPGSMAHVVIIAGGFGPERGPMPDHATSYWDDTSLPRTNKTFRQGSAVFLSGNGDGGLIDAVAAVLKGSPHAALIELVTTFPGFDAVHARLIAIDEAAKASEAVGTPYVIEDIYGAEIVPVAEKIGLIRNIAERLRPGMTLYLHTQYDALFDTKSAILNRVLLRLVMAAAKGSQTRIEHLKGGNVEQLDVCPDSVTGFERDARLFVRAGTYEVGVDRIIIRHGPDKDQPYRGFPAIISSYRTFREALAVDDVVRATPELSLGARRRLEDAAHSHDLALDNRRIARLLQDAPLEITIAFEAGLALWTSTLSPAELAANWRSAKGVKLTLRASPDELGPLAITLIRMAIHNPSVVLCTERHDWQKKIRDVIATLGSAGGLYEPVLYPPISISPAPTLSLSVTQASLALDNGLDADLLHLLNEKIEAFCAHGVASNVSVAWVVDAGLRLAMSDHWVVWKHKLDHDAPLLRRFVRLLASPEDLSVESETALVAAGPSRINNLVRASLLALAAAAGWQGGDLRAAVPGHLERPAHGEATKPRAFHACGADRIGGGALRTQVASFPWVSYYVLLSELNRSVVVDIKSHNNLATIDDKLTPRLDEANFGNSLIIPADIALEDALEGGVAALQKHLDVLENSHIGRWRAAISSGDGQ